MVKIETGTGIAVLVIAEKMHASDGNGYCSVDFYSGDGCNKMRRERVF